MKQTKKNQSVWGIILKVIIAMASAAATALGITACH